MAVVREVARERGAILCDLAERLGALPRDVRTRLFLDDGIHLTDAGNDAVAEALHECFRENGLTGKLIR